MFKLKFTNWFLMNDLLVNGNKTDAIVFGTRQQLSKMSSSASVKVGDCNISLSKNVKILGVNLDQTLSMDTQVNSVVASCNYRIRALRHVRKSITL